MTDLEAYVERLGACFADLPAAERTELLDDVAGHLAEVAAEDGRPLADRLGPPEQYAAELRVAAGLPAPGTAATTAFGRWKRRLGGLDRRTGPVVGYERTTDFLRQLAPAWWVLRGYAAAAVLLWAVDGPSLVPTIGGNAWAGGLISVAAVVASVWLGRRRPRAVPVRALAGAAQLVFAGLVLAATAQAAVVFDHYDEPSYPTEAEVTVPEQPRYLVACRDPATGVNRLMIGMNDLMARATDTGFCPDGYVAVFVPQPAEPRRVLPPTPAPTPS
jgi:hypothetical protein